MPPVRIPLRMEDVAFRRVGDMFPTSGRLELFNDRVVLKSDKYLSMVKVLVKTPPPTFPPAGINEVIPFLDIRSISEFPPDVLPSKNSRIELRTEAGGAWEIRGVSETILALAKAYRDWKDNKLR